MTTRSGTTIRKGSTSKVLGVKNAGIKKTTPKKKSKAKAKAKADGDEGEESDGSKLEAPLSVLTKDMNVPLFDIGEFVSRPSDERHRELEGGKSPGRVKRPMNAFMLYRKAFQLRIKEYERQNNHQIISQVCGKSWRMEPDEIK